MRLPKTLTTILGAGAIFLASLFSPKASAQTFFPSLNSKIDVFKQSNQTNEPSAWDTLSTWNQTIDLSDQYFAEDKSDTITHIQNGGKFNSGQIAMQTHLNFYGTSGYKIVPGDTDKTLLVPQLKSLLPQFNEEDFLSALPSGGIKIIKK